MRTAIVSDVHGNLTALEAVISDLHTVAPDLIVHGGDLVGGGTRPAEVIDVIRGLGWPGVQGNTDEMLWSPDRVSDMLRAPQLERLRDALLMEIIPATRRDIGEERLDWLRTLPRQWSGDDLIVVHAVPDDLWRAPSAAASSDELERTYGPLACPRVVYGHIHHAYVRRLPTFTIVNSGSVSLSYDGDRRAAYALVDGDQIVIRRVEYDVEEEVARLVGAQYPYAEWHAHILRTGTYVPMTA